VAIDYVRRPAGSAISLEKFQARAPDLVSLYKSAKVCLDKQGLVGERAAVYLVVDHSGSMRPFFRDGSVQALAERVLALAAHFDDDGVVPVIFFDTVAHPAVEVSVRAYAGAIDAIRSRIARMGVTDYAAAMQAVIDHYQGSGSTDPAYVVFQTDGSPTSRRAATKVLCEAARLPIFWQFVGFGDDEFAYLRRLDELSVPQKRVIDNAGFFAAGPAPKAVGDAHLYDRLMAEFPQWLRDARVAGIA
jgi:hypothetical protein